MRETGLESNRERIENMSEKHIDWSCKHDILIKNPDGSYSHMDELYYEAEELKPGVWKILSSGDYHYCVAGEKFAVAIDTGYGAGNLREYLEGLTGLPVPYVINTHSHFDHTANNGYFDKAYMHVNAIPEATVPFQSFEGIEFITDYERVGIDEGFLMDLGNKTLEIFYIPDHTMDGIAILDRADKTLFIGDEFMIFGKVLTKVTVETFYGYTQKLLAHRSEYDIVCGGAGRYEGDFIDRFDAVAKAILDGDKGMPANGKPPGRPGQMPPGPNGELVYDRKMPHFGDGGAGKLGDEVGESWIKEMDGIRITYDVNRIR